MYGFDVKIGKVEISGEGLEKSNKNDLGKKGIDVCGKIKGDKFF